ncbi:MAG: FAD-dependent oxidoreductase, partial [Acidobacteriaceae bacterium]|nr:FAD-dependent oxidoreductase [Acidobacteriaceae bacterium]
MSRPEPARPGFTVAIAGGGIIGLSIAWRLAQGQFRVTIYEKGSIGMEASWAGAGMLSPGGEIAAPSFLALLAIESRRLYPAFVNELSRASGMGIDYQECGALELAYSRAEMEMVEARAAAQAELGIDSKPLTPETVGVFCP